MPHRGYLTDNVVGNRNVGTTDPRNLEAVLKTQADGNSNSFSTVQRALMVMADFNLGFRIPQFRDLLGDCVFTQDGPAWKRSRDLLAPQFRSNRYQSFEDIRRCVESMLSKFEPGEVVDLQPIFFQLTLDTTLCMLFGGTALKMQSGANVARRMEFGNALNEAQEYLAYRTRPGDLHWLVNGPGMWRACRIVHTFVDEAINRSA
jgi:cytochrome P450